MAIVWNSVLQPQILTGSDTEWFLLDQALLRPSQLLAGQRTHSKRKIERERERAHVDTDFKVGQHGTGYGSAVRGCRVEVHARGMRHQTARRARTSASWAARAQPSSRRRSCSTSRPTCAPHSLAPSTSLQSHPVTVATSPLKTSQTRCAHHTSMRPCWHSLLIRPAIVTATSTGTRQPCIGRGPRWLHRRHAC